MQYKNPKISTQLKMGLGVVQLFVIFLGVVAWVQTSLLWQSTKDLYSHPFMVSRAVGQIISDVLTIHRGMKDICLADNGREREAIQRDMETLEADARRQFDILYERYLGNRQDLDAAFNALVQWNSIRRETIRLLQAGHTAEAMQRTKPTGVGGSHADKLLGYVQKVSDFARQKADDFFQEATRQHNFLRVQLAVVVGLILALTAGGGILLYRRIREPLKDLTAVTECFQRGDLDARSQYASANEFGSLSAAFNQMAEAISLRVETEQKGTLIAEALITANETKAFAETVLEKFMDITGSSFGAFYLRDKNDGLFSPLAAIGVSRELLEPFDASSFEGQLGLPLKTGRASHIRDIPEETLFTFKTFAGRAIPREIISLPVMVDEKVRGMLCLATVSAYTKASLVILSKQSMTALSTAFSNLLANDETRRLTEELRGKNVELTAQQEELQMQAEELRQQWEELQEQNIQLEQQRLAVEEASRLKSQFLSNMSHELRTPLNSVLALSRVLMMQARNKLSDEELNYLEIIERNGKNLLTLINDILDLSKIEAGRMDLHPRSFSLSLVLENVVQSILPLAEEKRIGIHAQVPANLPPIESDELRVAQILQNLLANAVKFTDKGSVTIAATCDEERVSVQIADTGIGIAQEDIPFIFDEFRQADGSSSRRHEGSGLGLAIARKAAHLLGGNIAVSSTLGAGSTFTLTLPLVWQGATPAHEPLSVGSTVGSRHAEKTILIVEDEPQTAAMISRYLLQEGYRTVIALSGEEALKLAASELPFAVTLDIIMPDMDGWEVLQGLKQNPATRDIPVIVVSVSEEKETGFALGAIGHVTKPVHKKRLISEIRRLGSPAMRSIMIVDDNEIDRLEIGRIVAAAGLTPVVAQSGSACLEMIEKEAPDLLVLDLMMPPPDGFAVLEKIRNKPGLRDLPVIVVTAKDLTEEDRSKLSGNVFTVLEKSAATAPTLLREIKRILLRLEYLPKPQASEKSPDAPRILLVEDNEAAIIQLRSVLQEAGYVVEVARGGQEACAYVSHTVPDGIVLDLMMPEVDGFAVLEKIRGSTVTANIPVLVLTAKDLTAEDFKRLSANHIQQLVQKGDVDRESLLAKMKTMLGGKLGAAPVELQPDGTRALRDSPQAARLRGGSQAAIVLIVEDNPDNMTTLKAVLQDRYQILQATDGEEGLRIASQACPDLILLDIALPKMDGFAVVRQLKDDENLRHIPVIALTAQVMKGDREKIVEAGCDDYIPKPIEPESLLSKIRRWLKG